MIAILATSRQVNSVTGRQETSVSVCGPPSVPFLPITSMFCIDEDNILVRLGEMTLHRSIAMLSNKLIALERFDCSPIALVLRQSKASWTESKDGRDACVPGDEKASENE